MPRNVLVRYFSEHSRVNQNFQTGTMAPVPGTFHAIMVFHFLQNGHVDFEKWVGQIDSKKICVLCRVMGLQ